MKKAWFYEIFFFQVVIVMVKDKERCTIKYTMSIKISAMHLQELHYVNKSKVTSSFQGICLVCIFLAPFFYSLSMSIGKRSTIVKIWGSCSPGFYGPDFNALCISRGGSRIAATSEVNLFVIIVNGFQPLTIITKSSTLPLYKLKERWSF